MLLGDECDSATKDSAKQLCERFCDIVELRIARLLGITLVRPDGYIVYTGKNSNRSVTSCGTIATNG